MKKKKRARRVLSRNILLTAVAGAVALFLFMMMIIPMKNSIAGAFIPTAQYLEAYPGEKPAFLDYDLQENYLHIVIYGHILWEAGDNYLTDAALSQRFTLKINEAIIENTKIPYGMGQRATPLNSQPMMATDGNLAGQADNLNIFVSLADFADGLHIAELEIPTSSGQIHHHKWAFRVGDAGEVVYPTLAVIPTDTTLTPTP